MSILRYTRTTIGAGHNTGYEPTRLDFFDGEQFLTRIDSHTMTGKFMWRGVEYKFQPRRMPFVGRKYQILGGGREVGEIRLARGFLSSKKTALKIWGDSLNLMLMLDFDAGADTSLQDEKYRIVYKPEVPVRRPGQAYDYLSVSNGEIDTGGVDTLVVLLGLCVKDLEAWDLVYQAS
ncbi:hypothetical protein [Dawidia soli]|uniref:Uncharacterized protein n=1 Tax=Dawidia soli TaxID=2782352 RepID=A0AAP2D826_9BACT|nr:hypothetical protein [Dawidia soli]MBT1686864.1 hypothetical protein [Dawidia soli]